MMQRDIFNLELVRVTAAGSVDDGKSTLIGRLLYELDQVFDDQLAALENAERLSGQLDFSLLTDGLVAEREQKITIDVAYRYCTIGQRRFIIADVPGHEQYTRNMMTGASRADVMLILVDARHSLTEQTRRHLAIAALLGIRHVAVLINKMDLVEYEQSVFTEIVSSIAQATERLGLPLPVAIPCSALQGDMVHQRGNKLAWFKGPTVREYLEQIDFSGNESSEPLRVPVQYVVRPNQDFRGYAGEVAGGSRLSVGDEVVVLPSGNVTSIDGLWVSGERRGYANPGEAILFTTKDRVDISRGDVVARPQNLPVVSANFVATLCWFSATPHDPSKRYFIKHRSVSTSCFVSAPVATVEMETLKRLRENGPLLTNQVGDVRIQTTMPLVCDPYATIKEMGCFILIDEFTNDTVAAGVVV